MSSSSNFKQFFVVLLSLWILTIQGSNESFGSTRSPTRQHSSRPNLAAAAEEPDVPSTALSTGQVVQEDEGIPTWVLVIVSVVCGLVFVACCLCALKIYQWRNDQGRYSIWNTPNVESMYARESGVLFEKLDVEASLCEDQCYEIPVDSFLAPQRIYIGGARVEAIKEGIEDSIRSTERRMSESAKRLASVGDGVEYCAVTDVIKRESDLPSINGSTYGDVSQRSSASLSTRGSLPDRVLTPSNDNNNSSVVESYCKPLPVPKLGEPVTCQTYELTPKRSQRFNPLVNRPLPQTPLAGSPPLSPPSVIDSCASLDRSLLKQQKQNEFHKKVMFRTLPRPRRLRQLPVPFVNAVAKSTSSTDVSHELRLKDHVACESRECTLTRVKKRMSQSLDTLLTTERASHFYENPDVLPPAKDKQKHEGSEGVAEDSEDLPPDMEHLYSRISTFLDVADGNLNRHSYASVHYPGGIPFPDGKSRPKSRHTYISIIFGSTEPVFDSSKNEPAKDGGIAKSLSCSDLSKATTTNSEGVCVRKKPARHAYVNIDIGSTSDGSESLAPSKCSSTNDHDGSRMVDEENRSVGDSARNTSQSDDTFMSSYENQCPYVNVNEALESSFGNGDRAEPAMASRVHTGGNSSDHADNSCPTDDSTTLPFSEGNSSRFSTSSNPQSESYYGVPKHPAIPLKRFQEILGTSVPAGNENDGDFELYKKANGFATNVLSETQDNAKTLSTYLEGRFSQDPSNNGEPSVEERPGHEVNARENPREDNKPREDSREGPVYENFIPRNRHSANSLDSLSSSNDKISVASSLSIDENESQPLITAGPGSADVNGNSVEQNRKLELKQDSQTAFLGESVA